jgi:uridine kinase
MTDSNLKVRKRFSLIRSASPRRRVQARLSDGRIFEAPPGTALKEVMDVAFDPSDSTCVAAIVGGHLCELSAPLNSDSDVRPVNLADADGTRIYRRSLSFMMLAAIADLFPDAEVFIEHSATTSAAYFCEIQGREAFSANELRMIEAHMRKIVAENAPIVPKSVPVGEAMQFFQARGEDDIARLLAHRTQPSVTLYSLCGYQNFTQGLMVPSAGCLRYFTLYSFPPGFMLQFPHQSRPTEITHIDPYPKLFSVFEEAGHWLNRLGIRSVGALNDGIIAGRLPEVSLVAEALQEARIAKIASDIAALAGKIRVVLVAGPSSSGKTTFAKRLGVQLLANGLRPFPVSLDDYFVPRDRTPRDENNDLNFETIKALNLELFNQQLLDLMAGKSVQLPHYDFAAGFSSPGQTVSLRSDDILIVEGIHGLNPALVPHLPEEKIYRVYVSALTQLNLDRHHRINTTDCRLIRRIVRDAATRGYNAAATLQRWDSVIAGEKQNIFPFQEHSDAIFNSALVHELSILRPLAGPLLLQVRPESPHFIEANRLLSLLQWFHPALPNFVPDNSILREFIGGSILDSFRLWPAAKT